MTSTYRWARRAIWGTLLVVMTIGCNPLATIAFLTHKDTPKKAPHPLFPKEEGKEKEKEEVTVAAFIFMAPGLGLESAGAEHIIASELTRRMPEMAKEVKKKVIVIRTQDVNKLKMQNPNWRLMHANARGKQLSADYVLDIHLNKLSLYQPGSNDQFYEGRAEVMVEMYKVDGEQDPVHWYTHLCSFPPTGFRDATSMPASTFRKALLERLAVEIAQKHIDFKADSGIAEGQ